MIRIKQSEAKGIVAVPASKSYLQRYILASFYSKDKIIIGNVTYSNDVHDALNAIQALGKKVTLRKNEIVIEEGKKPSSEYQIKESATTLRLLIPILFTLRKTCTIYCEESLLKRPLDYYKDLAVKNKFYFKVEKDRIILKGSLKAGNYIIDSPKTSQFVTGMLLTLPSLKGKSTLKVVNQVSKPYVKMTLETLNNYGIKVDCQNDIYTIEGRQKYIGNYWKTEGDWSQAAYFFALALFNEDLLIRNVNLDSLQGDKAIL